MSFNLLNAYYFKLCNLSLLYFNIFVFDVLSVSISINFTPASSLIYLQRECVIFGYSFETSSNDNIEFYSNFFLN